MVDHFFIFFLTWREIRRTRAGVDWISMVLDWVQINMRELVLFFVGFTAGNVSSDSMFLV